jgi:hypothetical protein
MDEATIREHARAHAAALAAGDPNRAAQDLTDEARAAAGPVMKALPRPVETAEVTGVTAEGDEFVAGILYSGGGSETLVVSRWAERDGRPMIVALALG